VIIVCKNFEVSDAINTPFPMNKLHVTQKNVFKLEIGFLGDEWFFANPQVTTGPFEMNFDLLPLTKFLGRTDNSN